MKLLTMVLLICFTAACNSGDSTKENVKKERPPAPPPGAAFAEGTFTAVSPEERFISTSFTVDKYEGGANTPSVKSGSEITVQFPKTDSLSEKLSGYQENHTEVDIAIKAEKVFGSENEFHWRFIGFRENNRSHK